MGITKIFRHSIKPGNIWILVLSLLLTSCAGVGLDEGGSQGTLNQNFYQKWVNSYEEQSGNGQIIFRPAGSREFPPSRFRMAYTFNIDGSCQFKYLSPDDRHEMRECVFTKVGNKVYIYDEAGKLVPELSFTLAQPASKEILKFTHGVAQPKPDKAASSDATQK